MNIWFLEQHKSDDRVAFRSHTGKYLGYSKGTGYIEMGNSPLFFTPLAKNLEGKLRPEEIQECTISDHLYTADMPDPDLLVRTAGEMRVSNYLLWQIAYSELYVTPTLWPDFRKVDFLRALRDYAGRQRRFGS